MTSFFLKRRFRNRSDANRWKRPIGYRPWLEQLETRILLDAGLPPTIVLGRTLSSYTTGGIQNNQESINFTVYNDQANPVTGVLLTDTLQNGLAIVNASPVPDQSGQQVAWSLGTINGFDRASVTLTLSLPNPIPLQLDSGAQAFATLDAGMVSISTPAATLRQGSVDPSLLASTPDANTTDPFIQEEAAALSYNAQNIFSFLHSSVGYNSYLGSVRGARGTLWSNAGNALDVASLGVALMRASGISAQYVQGTLPSGQAQNLILSMFPASYQTAGYIPVGTTTADPAHDPQLLAETEAHYWFQFDTGAGFQNADPLIGTSTGQTFTASQGTFTEVPDNLREKTEVTLNAEIYSQADAAFGLGLKMTTVLDQTFNDVDLVGRPVTVGNFVTTTTTGGLAFSFVTNTYSPYLQLGDDAYDASQDQLIRGTDYQEMLNNFPLGSQYLTGLFLNFTLSGPQGAPETYSKTLLDRIGFAARQAGGPVQIAPVDPSSQPVITPFDLYTISVLPGGRDPDSVSAPGIVGSAGSTLQAFAIQYNMASSQERNVLAQQASQLIANALIAMEDSEIAGFEAQATVSSKVLENSTLVVGYSDRPRITIASTRLLAAPSASATNFLEFGFDLLKSNYRVVVAPSQSLAAQVSFNIDRGLMENTIEGSIVANVSSLAPSGVTSFPIFTGAIFSAAVAQGIPLVRLQPEALTQVDQLPFSAEVKARIGLALSDGESVIVPSRTVMINGKQVVGWYDINEMTGETTGLLQDGSHGAASEYLAVLFDAALEFGSGAFSGFVSGSLNWVAAFQIQLAINDSGNPRLVDLARVKNDASTLAAFLANKELIAILPGPAKAGFLFGLLVANTLLFDPPLPPSIFSTQSFINSNVTNGTGIAYSSSISSGLTQGTTDLQSLAVGGQIGATWNSSSITGSQVATLSASGASVQDAAGQSVGFGVIALSSSSIVAIKANGNHAVFASGMGNLAFYGPAESNLGVSGNWINYTATLTGIVSITLTTDGLTLNGQALPAGTYTITTSSATLSGSGATTSPNFSGSASITTTSGTVDLGPGTGSVTVGGNSLNSTNGVTLTGYSGTIGVAAGGGNNTDSVTLNGTAANVLTVSPSPSTFLADQNTPVTFQTNVKTSFADTYTITAQAPTGWTVSVDNNGTVTATPAPGLQSGTYPIQVIAQSTTNPDLVAQATVNVTIKPTSKTITLSVAPDPLITVPFNGAQLPTAFVATIHNYAPTALTVSLAFSNLPTGFTLLDSGTKVTIPAGANGSLGIYFQPTSQLPPPGSQYSFTVTATASGVPTVKQTVSFTVPAIDAITLAGSSATINAAPGATATEPITITNVGNVPENVALSASATTGLTVAGLLNLSLQPGQSMTENASLTPDVSTPLNSFLQATITATFGPSNAPQTTALNVPVNVVVPGALAITNAVTLAAQLGETGLVTRLSDLSGELTSLTLNPTDAVAKSQVLVNVAAIIGLLANDDYLANLTTAFTNDRTVLAQAVTAADILNALTGLGNDLGSIATTLSDEIAHSVVLQLDPNQGQARPQVAVLYPLSIQNVGTQTTTYDLSVSGLPTSVTASFNQTSVTLTPGQQIFGGPNGITLTLTETGATLVPTSFAVTATAEGAPEIDRSATGSLTVRDAFVQVTAVTPSPSFTNPGAKVDVKAQIVNITANTLTAQAYYTVTDPSGNLVFTSTPVSVPFSIFVNVTTVDLGSFDTTGLADGSYVINVIVTDTAGKPLTNVVGQGSVLIGTPVTASLTSTPGAIFPFFAFPAGITTTLKVDAQASFAGPLTLDGITATDGPEASVSLDGTLAYVCGIKDVSIIDASVPSSPQVLGTFGSDALTPGSSNVCRVAGNLLLIGSQIPVNSNSFNLIIYSIADPLHPVLLSNTSINYHFLGGLFVQGTTAYIPIGGANYFVGVVLTDQFGDFLAVDFSNPTKPNLEGVLFNNRGAPDGSDHTVSGGAIVNGQTTYIGTTTSAGSNSQAGTGEVLVVNTTDPSHMAVSATLPIPDTVQAIDVAIQGNRALVVGSTEGLIELPSGGLSGAGLAGNLTLTMLDITNPLNPLIIGSTVVTKNTFFTAGANLFAGGLSVAALGNDVYAVSDTALNGNSEILLADASDPTHLVLGGTQTASPVNEMTVAGGLLYVAGQDGLLVYSIGQVLGVPLTVSAIVPVNAAVSYDPTSFNIVPSQIVHGAGFDTLTWVSSLGAGATDLTLTWTSELASLQPPETVPLTLGATVDFISQGTPGAIALPGTNLTVPRYGLISVLPASNAVQPGVSAGYTVRISGKAGTPDVYNITVAGLPANWVSVPAVVTAAPNTNVDVPLTVLSDPAAPLGTYNFTVFVTDGPVTDSRQVSIVLKGQPVLPPTDPDSHGVVATLTPAKASAGQGTAATYVVQVTNTGSADDSLALSAAALPPGVAATFAQTTIDVPPGASNFRDVALTLTPPLGTAPGSYDFTVTATSTTKPSIANTASGNLNVLGNGVSVALSPSSGPPGGSFQMTVTNTGQSTDTFDLALAGPAALVSQLPISKLTLDAGASQEVSIDTGSITFAVPGNLELAAIATSEANSSVQGDATADLNIPTTTGMTASFNPASQIIPAPGTASFLLQVNNSGNVEDAYTATITGTTGSVSASLTGLTGQSTTTIPLFRLPGLSTGAVLLQANGTMPGQSTVTVQVTSLSNGAITATAIATLIVQAPTPKVLVSDPGGTYNGSAFAATATVNAASSLDGVGLTLSYFVGADTGGQPLTGAPTGIGTYTVAASYPGSPDSVYPRAGSSETFTIAAAPLTVTADNKQMTYGGTVPALTFKIAGFVGNDNQNVVSGIATLTTAIPNGIGTAPITFLMQNLSAANYAIGYVNGVLTVGQANLAITAENKSKVFGAAVPPLTVSYSGLVNGDSPASLTTLPAISTTAAATSIVGIYPITAGGAVDPNYIISYVSGTLSVNQAATQVASLTTSASSINASQLLTLTATVGVITPGNGIPTGLMSFQDGTMSLGTVPVDKNGTAVLNILAGALAIGPHSFTATYAGDPNFAPSQPSAPVAVKVTSGLLSVSIAGSPTGVRGQPLTFTLTVSNGSAGKLTGTFTYAISWGDGSAGQSVSGPSAAQVTHKFVETGIYTVSVIASDATGLSSKAATQTVTIAAYAIQVDPTDGKRVLVVGSGGHDSEVEIEKSGCSGALVVEIENRKTERYELNVTITAPIDRIELYGQKSDELSVAENVRIDALIHAGTGNSILQGGGGNNVLVGGPGDDILIGGEKRNVLIGGLGRDLVYAGDDGGDSIVIGGTTSYDANDVALLAILQEWTRPDADYNTRVGHLTGTLAGGLNGTFLLNTSTVHDDGVQDLLIGGHGKDLFFQGAYDTVRGKEAGDLVIKE